MHEGEGTGEPIYLELDALQLYAAIIGWHARAGVRDAMQPIP